MIEYDLIELNAEQWADISTTTLKYSFGYDWPKEKCRATKAILVRDKKTEEPLGYMTLVEFDAESVYLQHGGNFPASRGTTSTFKTYLMMVKHVKSQYKFLSTRIFNHNIAMLKMALAVGFIITGTQLDHFGDLYLVLELRNQ